VSTNVGKKLLVKEAILIHADVCRLGGGHNARQVREIGGRRTTLDKIAIN
jgi:hypothetical protein